jgi:acyl-CoA thioesterase FadM
LNYVEIAQTATKTFTMNLYLRLLWTIFRAWRLAPIAITDTLERQLRVLPTDIDINGHMNNGRYLTIVDLALLEYFTRIGAVKHMIKNGWRPMSGGALITYRKGLMPFQTYTLRFRRGGFNNHWNFMRFEFVRDNKICAAGYFKGAMVNKDGFVHNHLIYGALGLELGPESVPPAVASWLDAENQLMKTL